MLYSRLKRERVLDHFVRGQIYGAVVMKPGITYSEIRERMKVANGTLLYHLYTLEKCEFLRSERVGKFRRYYPRHAPVGSGGVMVSRAQQRILSIIEREPGVTQKGIAMKLGVRKQTVNYNVQRLVSAGLVHLEGWTFGKKCFPGEAGENAQKTGVA